MKVRNEPDVVRARLRLGGPCSHLCVGRKHRFDLGEKLPGRYVSLGGDIDLVELALLVKEGLCGLEVEDRKRRTAQRGKAPEVDDARDRVTALEPPAGDDADPSADLEVLGIGGVLIHRDVVGRRGPGAAHKFQRIEALVAVGIDTECEPGGTAVHDHLAVGSDELGGVADSAGRSRDVRELLDPDERRGRKRGRVLGAAEDRLAGHDRVRIGVGDGEDLVETGVDGVRQHEGSTHHRDAHYNRQRGQQEPQLAAQEILDRDADHCGASVSSSFIVFKISDSVAPRRSSTTCPSTR